MKCSKKAYKDSRAARGAIRTISKSPNQGKKPTRAYLCPNCDMYHITSATKDNYEAEKKRRKPKKSKSNDNHFNSIPNRSRYGNGGSLELNSNP